MIYDIHRMVQNKGFSKLGSKVAAEPYQQQQQQQQQQQSCS
jgi:hypothetical protein